MGGGVPCFNIHDPGQAGGEPGERNWPVRLPHQAVLEPEAAALRTPPQQQERRLSRTAWAPRRSCRCHVRWYALVTSAQMSPRGEQLKLPVGLSRARAASSSGVARIVTLLTRGSVTASPSGRCHPTAPASLARAATAARDGVGPGAVVPQSSPDVQDCPAVGLDDGPERGAAAGDKHQPAAAVGAAIVQELAELLMVGACSLRPAQGATTDREPRPGGEVGGHALSPSWKSPQES